MRKIQIAAVGIMVALVALIAGGTVTYYSGQADAVNDYSVGTVDVSLSEGVDFGELVIDSSAQGAQSDPEKGGPVVTVSSDSGSCWAFITMEFSKWKSMGMMYAAVNGGYGITAAQFNDDDAIKAVIRNIVESYYTGFEWDDFEIMNWDGEGGVKPTILATVADSSQTETYLKIIFGKKVPLNTGDEYQICDGVQIPAGITPQMLYAVHNFTNGTYSSKVSVCAIQNDFLFEEGEPNVYMAYMVLQDALSAEAGSLDIGG